jgi:hypothetical protein
VETEILMQASAAKELSLLTRAIADDDEIITLAI